MALLRLHTTPGRHSPFREQRLLHSIHGTHIAAVSNGTTITLYVNGVFLRNDKRIINSSS